MAPVFSDPDFSDTYTIGTSEGPDAFSDSAIQLDTGMTATLTNSAVTNGTLLIWAKTASLTITGLSLTQVDSYGSWYLYKATGAISASLVLDASVEDEYFDIRIYDDELSTNEINYYFNDVKYNYGDNVLGYY